MTENTELKVIFKGVAAVKELRERTGMGYSMCADAWNESNHDLNKALEILKTKGATRAEKLHDRSTGAGFTGVYRHHDGRTVTIVQLLCETDFVSNMAEFRALAEDLAMQVVQGTLSVAELQDEDMLTRPGTTVGEALKNLSAKTGERVAIGLVQRHVL